MNFDPYTQEPIHQHGIWSGTNCLGKERAVMDSFGSTLTTMGWEPQDSAGKKWRRGDKTVLVVLVDDIRSTSLDRSHMELPYLYDEHTTVITDSWIGCPTMYRVWRLPGSFFGIYHGDWDPGPWQPDRDFVFSINRMCPLRLKLMLELAKRQHLHKGYVNFNGVMRFHGDEFDPTDDPRANFERLWQDFGEEDQQRWRASYRLLTNMMPVHNYDIAHHEIFTRSWINIECETYSGDNSAAYSEKIFRLLTTPVPWTCYTGRYGLAYLRSLGFDIVDDLLDHAHYDSLKEVEQKVGIYIWKALGNIAKVKAQDQSWLRDRYQQAAQHNRDLLAKMHARWVEDFDQWSNHHMDQLS